MGRKRTNGQRSRELPIGQAGKCSLKAGARARTDRRAKTFAHSAHSFIIDGSDNIVIFYYHILLYEYCLLGLLTLHRQSSCTVWCTVGKARLDREEFIYVKSTSNPALCIFTSSVSSPYLRLSTSNTTSAADVLGACRMVVRQKSAKSQLNSPPA